MPVGLNEGPQRAKRRFENAKPKTLKDEEIDHAGIGRRVQLDPESGFSTASLGFSLRCILGGIAYFAPQFCSPEKCSVLG